MKVKWEGVYPALTTAFTKKGDLDLEVFAHNVKAQIKAGIHGMIIGGSLGEASTLLQEEKMQLLATCLKLAKKKIPVVINIAERSTQAAIAVAQEAQAKLAQTPRLIIVRRVLDAVNQKTAAEWPDYRVLHVIADDPGADRGS